MVDMDKEFLNELLENIAKQFGHNCEVVLHDFTGGVESSVVKIINGHVTGREVGAASTNRRMEAFASKETGNGVYYTHTPYGQLLKCSSTAIKDETGNIVGGVCINYDITDLMKAQRAISSLADYDSSNDENVNEHEKYFRNVNELLEYYLGLAENKVGKPAAEMTKKERMEALSFLDEKGILQISKASNRLCEFFGISRFTLYSYLDEIRKENQ